MKSDSSKNLKPQAPSIPTAKNHSSTKSATSSVEPIWTRGFTAFSRAFSSWGLTTYESRAISLLILVVLGASAVRYYQHRSIERRLQIIHSQQQPKAEAEPNFPEKPRLIAPIDINTASAHELQRLPGVGPVLAERIVEWREKNGQFKSLEDFDQVKGVGPSLLEKAGPWILLPASPP